MGTNLTPEQENAQKAARHTDGKYGKQQFGANEAEHTNSLAEAITSAGEWFNTTSGTDLHSKAAVEYARLIASDVVDDAESLAVEWVEGDTAAEGFYAPAWIEDGNGNVLIDFSEGESSSLKEQIYGVVMSIKEDEPSLGDDLMINLNTSYAPTLTEKREQLVVERDAAEKKWLELQAATAAVVSSELDAAASGAEGVEKIYFLGAMKAPSAPLVFTSATTATEEKVAVTPELAQTINEIVANVRADRQIFTKLPAGMWLYNVNS